MPIDPDLAWPHPASFSVDHIVPLSLGGDVKDPANMRAAHLGCNSSRGNGRRSTRSTARRDFETHGATLGPDGMPVTPGDRSASW